MTNYKSPVDVILENEHQKRLREVALKDFMCAIMNGIYSDINSYNAFKNGAKEAGEESVIGYIMSNANELTEAYINELNKPQ